MPYKLRKDMIKSTLLSLVMFAAPITGLSAQELIAPPVVMAQVDYFSQPYTPYPAPLGSWAFSASMVVYPPDGEFVDGHQGPSHRRRIISAFYSGEVVIAERAYIDYTTGADWYLVENEDGVMGWVDGLHLKAVPPTIP